MPDTPNALVPPEDQPLAGQTGVRPRSPAWTVLLTPGAIIAAGLLLAGVIWITRDESAGSEVAARGPLLAGGESAAPSPPSTAGSRPTSLLAAFLQYADAAELDRTAFQQCLFDTAEAAVISAQLERGTKLGVSGTPTFFINNKKIVGAQPAAIFREVIDRELGTPPTSLDAYSASVQALAATSPPRFEIMATKPDVSDAAFDGDPGAKVVIAEFSDFQCPFCRRWNEETLGVIRPLLGDDVALAFLHFPILQIHANAGNASLAAICAGKQGRFWEMHDLLFAHQTEWQSLGAN